MVAVKKYKAQIIFHLLLNLVFAAMVTYASFVHVPLSAFKDHLLYFGHLLLLQWAVFGFLYLISIHRWIFSLLFPLVFLLCSLVSYWVYVQDIAISYHIVQASLESKPDIVVDLISFPLVLHFLLSVLICVVFIRYRCQLKGNQAKSPLLLLALAGIFIFVGIEHAKKGLFSRRLPFNIAYSMQEYFAKNELKLKPVPKTTRCVNDSLNIVLILGESVRADHLHLNGYARNTNPLLSKRQQLISFTRAYTTNTYTAKSLPQIFTDASLQDEYTQSKYSLIQVLNQAGIETLWIGNQTPEKRYELFINQSKFHKILDPLHSELSFQKQYDGSLLPEFKKVFRPGRNQFTVLHMIGSHWWYETRYPNAFRKFTPVIRSKHIPSNAPQEMINSYDNTLLYLDYFINETIEAILPKNSNTLVIYLSDHGESLGENGQWLHAQSGKELTNPALLFWYTPQFSAKHPDIVSKLEANRQQTIGLDFFFQTILDLYQVQGIDYSKDKIIYR